MAANGKSLKSAEVFTAIKPVKKREDQSHIRSKVSASNERLNSRLLNSTGVTYNSDTLQVKVYSRYD